MKPPVPGLRLVPLRRNGKEAFLPDTFHIASADDDVIAEWDRLFQFPDYGAVPESIGCFVVDIDPRHDGDKTWAALCAQHEPIPKTATMRSGGGGLHIWFRLPDGETLRKVSGCWPGIDIQGSRSYVKIAGGHPSGGTYSWIQSPEEGIAETPAWLLDAIRKHRVVPLPPRHTHRPAPSGPKVPLGARNDWLFRAMIADYHAGQSRQATEAHLAELDATELEAPVGGEELASVMQGFLRYAPVQGSPLYVNDSGWAPYGKRPTRDRCGEWAAMGHESGEDVHVQPYLQGCRSLLCSDPLCQQVAIRRQVRAVMKNLRSPKLLTGTFWNAEGGPTALSTGTNGRGSWSA